MKYSGSTMVKVLLVFFNQIFSSGVTPISWKLAIITPVLKNFDKMHDPDGYRGIAVLCVIGKLFCVIMNARPVNFCETNDALHDEQNGFRPGRGTTCTDSIFILSDSEVIQMRSRQNKATFCALRLGVA